MNQKVRDHVVINRNAQGGLVATIISAIGQEQAVAERWSQLGTRYNRDIVAVSGALPSTYGTGAAYLYAVNLIPPATPAVIVQVLSQLTVME